MTVGPRYQPLLLSHIQIKKSSTNEGPLDRCCTMTVCPAGAGVAVGAGVPGVPDA